MGNSGLLLLLVLSSRLNTTGAAPAPEPSTSTGDCGCDEWSPSLPLSPPPSGEPQPSPSEEPPSEEPPSEEPQPSDFADMKLYQAYKVIQRFKQTITCDPMGITSSWEGAGICDYYQGLSCDHPPGNLSSTALASIDFNGYGLCAPTLSGLLDELPDLAFFHANSNNFSGPFPELPHLPFFYELDVSNNRFTGPFPTTVFQLPELIFLDLRYNAFSGLVPPTAFTLQLTVLFLNNNMFLNSLPSTLGSSTANYLTLANNGFTGQIPHSIGNAAGTLIEASLLNNKLSGCLPYEIGLLREMILLDVGNNRLTGPIPYSFGCLAKMEQLNLAGNYLFGEVPEVVCMLGNLQNMSLSDNYFTRLGPVCRGLARDGVLDLRSNCIAGLPEQRSQKECLGFLAGACGCAPRRSFYYMPCRMPPRCGNFSDDGHGWRWRRKRGEKWKPPYRVHEAMHRGGTP